TRLDRLQAPSPSGGLALLENANRAEVARRAEASRHESRERTETERRTDLGDAAQRAFEHFSGALKQAITQAAPSVVVRDERGGWSLSINRAVLSLSALRPHRRGNWGAWQPPAFDVVASS